MLNKDIYAAEGDVIPGYGRVRKILSGRVNDDGVAYFTAIVDAPIPVLTTRARCLRPAVPVRAGELSQRLLMRDTRAKRWMIRLLPVIRLFPVLISGTSTITSLSPTAARHSRCGC